MSNLNVINPRFISPHQIIVDQFCALVVTSTSNSKDTVDHPNTAGARDDRSNAVAGVIQMLKTYMMGAGQWARLGDENRMNEIRITSDMIFHNRLFGT
jgi:hypothetical protein